MYFATPSSRKGKSPKPRSGYYATLSVYHSLHCLKRLHHLMYFDHYYPDKTEQEAVFVV